MQTKTPMSTGKRKREDVEEHQPTKRVVSPEASGNGANKVEADIVDVVNALPIVEFILRYVPPSVLGLKIPVEVPASNGNSDMTSKEKQLETVVKPATQDGRHTVTYCPAIYSSSDIPTRYYDACFNLIHKTSYATYKASSTGWSARKKRDEMLLDDMRYLLLIRDRLPDENEVEESQTGVRKSSRQKRSLQKDNNKAGAGPLPLLGGFMSFMTTYEDDFPVLYLYEIHLDPLLQNRGIGRTLMTVFEDIAGNIGRLKKTMLTVFRSNEASRRFYERLGYGVDEFSPEPRVLRGGVVRECDYLILSKEVNAEGSI